MWGRDEAGELLQEVLIRAYRGLKTYQGVSSFYTWIYRIAINAVFTKHRRRRKRASSVESYSDGGIEVADQAVASQPASRMEREESRRLIEHGLSQVPEQYRVVLILKDIEGLKYEQIADILDIPVGTVRSRLHRARGLVREYLQQ